MPSFTRNAIIASFLKLLNERPLHKITVKDIVEDCGINRNSFYYHFEDKYHMLRWMFQQEMQPALDAACTQGHWADSIPLLCERMRQDAALYMHLMQTLSPDNLPGLLLNYYKQAILHSAKEYFHRRRTNADEAEAVALYYAYGVVGSLMEWVRHGMRTDPCRIRLTIQEIVQEQVFHQ